MANKPTRNRDDSGEPPQDSAPPTIPGAAQTGMLVRALQESLQDSVSDLRREVSEMKTHAQADYHRLLYIFGAGFLAVAAMFGWGFTRLDDKVESTSNRLETKLEGSSSKAQEGMMTLGNTLTRVDQKLEDLLARIPPVPTPPPHR